MRIVIIAALAGLLIACGGGSKSTDVSNSARPTPTVENGFSDSALSELRDESSAIVAEYGLGFACLFTYDYTAEGWSMETVQRIIDSLGLTTIMTEPAINTTGTTNDGSPILSVYQDRYQGTSPQLRKVETADSLCYIPE